MNLLHVIGTMNPLGGGPCEGIRSLAPRLLEYGNAKTEVLCLDDPNSDYLSGETIRLHALGKAREPWNYHPGLRPWLKANSTRFDAIILHGLWQYPGFVLSKAARDPKFPPYFVFPHGMLDPWFQRAPERRLKAIRNTLYWKFVEQYVIAHAEAILFTCGEEMRLGRETFRPYQPRREIIVGLGACAPPAYHKRMEEAFAQKCPGRIGQPYFLFLGRIHPKKNVHFLLEAYAACGRSAGLSPLPKLVIAGPGLEAPYGRKMRQLASEICPPNSVFWPGMLTGDAKWGAFHNCEAFVLPSNQENFGIAVVESLACGRPVLISDQINIWREIKEAGAALVESNSVAGTTRLILDWNSRSPAAKSNMAASAQPCFRRHFSIESATRNLLAAIASRQPLTKNLASPSMDEQAPAASAGLL
jgi:glycosyltransferase involved in cell wall biosynthesis